MKKKQISILVSIAVIAVVAIGATLAFLHSTTETKTNTFSSNKNISIQLREPAWDGYEFTDTDVEPDGSTAKPSVTEYKGKALGVNEARNYVPGQTIYKDPTVKNNGDKNGVSAYVAIKVQYYKGTGENEKQISYKEFQELYLKEKNIDFNLSNWSLIENADSKDQIYLYGTDDATELAVGSVTAPLFTQVPISLDLEPGEDGKLPGFNIKVQAYAIQTVGVEDAGEALLNFIAKN